MQGYILLVVNLALAAAFFRNPTGSNIVDVGNDKDIIEANKGHKGSSGDDILRSPKIQRSSITDVDSLWESPVPYVLENDLELNAKGLTLRAFDQFRLKSCIDFKPRDSETYYISVQKLDGCFSYIGRVAPNGQVLSIGTYCDEISTIEHEFFHAFGFYHEQSRPDRDEYVTVVFENIQEGREHNFDKVSNETTTTHGVPYDYISVMHYGKNAFSNGNGSTIITKDPEFEDVIGQRLEMSPRDVQELNLLYSCNSTIAFKMHCSFSDGNMCQMNACSQSGNGWEMVTHVSGGPTSDHTSLPSGSNNHSQDTSYFMHASTADGAEGDSAWLETHTMSPNRDCHVQCLQFYYYHSGNQSDQLNIWIREFQDEWDPMGTLRLMGQITGQPTSHWQLQHVSLNATKHFRVEFEVHKGAGTSSGGFSIDDINLSEIECPHVTFQINDFENLLSTSPSGTILNSPLHYSSGGYAYSFGVGLYGTYVGLFVQLISGENDDDLEWPCTHRQVTFQMLDQNPNIQLQMSKQRSITTDRSLLSNDTYLWGNPRETGISFVDDNNETIFVGPLVGRSYFATLEEIQSRDFLKGGSVVFVFSFQDLTPLVNGSTLPCPQLEPVMITHPHEELDNAPCSPRIVPTSHPVTPTHPEITTHHPPHPTIHPEITTHHPPHPTIHPEITTHPPHPTIHPEITTHPPHPTIHPEITTHHPPHPTIHPEITTHHPPHPTIYPEITTHHPPTTEDDSIFGSSAVLVCSPVLALLLALMLLIP